MNRLPFQNRKSNEWQLKGKITITFQVIFKKSTDKISLEMLKRYFESSLNLKDLQNIILWYERVNNEDNLTLSDNRTITKVRAMLIYAEESQEELHQKR
jgi:hypothetical protein